MRVSNTDGSDSNLTTLLSQEKFPRTMSEIAFTYQPLSAEADTRIIELQPAPDALYPLQCRIAELCLSSEDLVDYEALSYTWGQPDFSECLFVLQDNGQRSVLKITLNLKEALQRLRLRDRDRRIWVDAVCIDQQDDTDKTHQIPSMTQIYKSAGRVLVWLGWSPEGQRALVDIKKAMRFHSRDDEKIRSHISNLSRSFENLVNLPWFSRRWVIQEVVLAADVVVICGLEEFPFVQLLRMVINLLRDAKTLDHTTQTALGPLAAISKLWGAWVFDSDGVKGLRLYDLLQVFANLDCAEDHDKVFALCGLASDCIISDKELNETPTNKVSIVIDYNQPAGILCQSITEQMLGLKPEQILGLKPERDNGFEWMNIMQKPVFKEVINAAVERCDGDYQTDRPLWTPNWCLLKRRETLYSSFGRKDGRGKFAAKKDRYHIHPDELSHTVSRNPLELLQDELMCLVTSVFEPFPEHPNTREIKGWLRTMQIVFSKCVADSTLAYPAIQKLLRCYFGESEVDNLPSDVDEMCMHPDSAWWYFLLVIARRLLYPQGSSPKDVGRPVYHHQDLYDLSLGKTDIDSNSRYWSHFCSAFRGRRLFLFNVEHSERSLSGLGVGPDHLASETYFTTDRRSATWGMPVHTLAWYPQAGRAPALVGDVWHFTFEESWLTRNGKQEFFSKPRDPTKSQRCE